MEVCYGVKVKVVHKFSMENVEYKQRWILHHFNPELLFDDMTKFVDDDQLKDIITDSPQSVPQVDLYVVGFECDTISPLNLVGKQGQDVVSKGAGKTGKTAGGAIAYIQKRRPSIFILENLKNINSGASKKTSSATNCKLSDLQVILQWCNDLGYYVVYRTMQALQYGAVTSRDRYYLFGVKCGSPGSLSSQLADDWVGPAWFSKFRGVLLDCEIPSLPVESFLLPNSDERVIAMKAEFEATAAALEYREQGPPAKKKKKEPREESWLSDHDMAFGEVGITWPPVYDQEFELMVRGWIETDFDACAVFESCLLVGSINLGV